MVTEETPVSLEEFIALGKTYDEVYQHSETDLVGINSFMLIEDDVLFVPTVHLLPAHFAQLGGVIHFYKAENKTILYVEKDGVYFFCHREAFQSISEPGQLKNIPALIDLAKKAFAIHENKANGFMTVSVTFNQDGSFSPSIQLSNDRFSSLFSDFDTDAAGTYRSVDKEGILFFTYVLTTK